MGTPSTAVTPEEPARKSFPARLAGVFLSPGETFEDIVRAPDILAPLALGVIASVVFVELMLAKIGIERIMRQQIAMSSRASTMTPEQIDQAVSQGAKIGAIFTHILGVLGPPIFLLIIAAVGLGIVSLIFGAKTKFGTAFSVTCYANLVNLLGAVMGIVFLLFGDPEHFNPNTPVPSSLGFFLDQAHTSKPLFTLASSLDVFTLWFMALLGTGFSAVTRRQAKPLSVFFAFFGLWVVVVLAKMGWASIG
jgi:Yip1 domain